MLPFHKILFPVDYSAPCRAIVPYIKEIRQRFSTELTLVHAYGPEALAYSSLPISDPDLPEAARAHEDQRLREFALEVFPGEHVETCAELGEPGTAIHKLLQHQGADLIMLATHGRGPIRRLLLGSVAAKVLHDASAAVWTGTGSALMEHPPQIPYRSILCAVDDSDEAEGVLKAAAALAAAYDARWSLVHVLETPPEPLEVDFTPYNREALAAADFRLRELKGQCGIDAPHAVLDGMVAGVLRQEALRQGAGLIVTGRGAVQSRFSRLWSHLYQIVRESPCPVLSI
ncbi:MAG TPA: universal stress protein [Bryobacteraceae bacterium]|nr:universal stress protein [Bryobacteraceae bacterium]